MKLAVLDDKGKEVRKLDVDDSVFGIEPNMAVLHQAYVRQRNNNRQGNAKTKTRGEVQGSTRKIRMQKYTGRARAGGNRSPTRVGGGTAFGPRPRSYERDMPKKMRRLAIRSALSGKVADGQLVVIDQLALETPRTKEIIRLLSAVGFERSALVVTGSPDRSVTASVRNLKRAKALPAAYLNVLDMLNHAGVVMTEEAVRIAEELWGQKAANGGKPLAPRRHSETIGVEKPKPERPATDQKPKAKAKTEPEAEEAAAPVAEAPAQEAPSEETPKPKRARAAKAEKPAAEAPAEARAEEAPAADAPAAEAAIEETPKPKRARTAKPKAEASTEEKPAESAEEAPKPKRAPRKKKTEETE
jgi:large subunit ribosomal protein L4